MIRMRAAPVAAPSEKFTTPVEKFNKTSSARGSVAPASSVKKRSSVDKSTPRSSRSKISSDSVTGKSANHLSVKKSATEPQRASQSNIKQKTATGQSSHSSVVVASASSSHKTADSLTKMPMSGRPGAKKESASKFDEGDTDLSDLKTAETALGLKGKNSTQKSATKVISARQKVSEKQPVTVREDSRPASRLSVYVSHICTNRLFGY